MAFTFYLTDREAAFIAGLYGLVLLYLIHRDLAGIKWELRRTRHAINLEDFWIQDPHDADWEVKDDDRDDESVNSNINHATDP